ncbi:phosphotransferase enzyme family protein [Gorillibacterium timonense]|uniref:phosphotransferase enzyme family protein n=1 Tax=Gorillibacterium timonense TaxID=1689269 RepID=UPI00071E48D4|nr:phosphotransferase [Gorillibacterium timonense]
MKTVPNATLSELARAYRTDAAALTYFNGGHDWSDGILYTYKHEEQTRILKVMEVPAAEIQDKSAALAARLKYVRFLGEREIPIVYPVPTASGELDARSMAGDRMYIAYSYVMREGVPIYELPHEERITLFARWGETLGRMHAAAQDYPDWDRLPEDPEGRLLGWQSEWSFFHSWCKDEEVKESWRQLKTELDALPVERTGFGFTHNDLHIGNVIAHQGQVTVLDFDVSNPHWFACDLAIALYSLFTYAAEGRMEHPSADNDVLKQVIRAFLDGYESANRLDAFWYERIELFLRYRRTLMFFVFSDEMERSNPEHRLVWRKRILEKAPFPEYDLGL